MADQPHLEPLEASDFFPNGMASRPLVEGTVARGHLRIDKAYFEGQVDGKPVEQLPWEKVATALHLDGSPEQTRAHVLERGRERFNIFCSACHDQTGSGQGMVVQRGFPAPPTYHSDRLRAAPDGHFYDVITRGFGRMSDYADQIPPADRWAIVSYIRALQLSQHAAASELSPADRKALQAEAPAP
ncbi:c-type cytochrome [Lignipirellula cremea]|nr:cytochrome c [Lignipirellula cremea]